MSNATWFRRETVPQNRSRMIIRSVCNFKTKDENGLRSSAWLASLVRSVLRSMDVRYAANITTDTAVHRVGPGT